MSEAARPASGSNRPAVAAGPTGDNPAGLTAGAIMKAARERQGLHIAILAATIKVSPRKLEALEQDRYDELSNASFVRALAQSVCRSLKIDPRPVLALLPVPDPAVLERAVGTLNAPFRERPGRHDSSMSPSTSRPALWAGALLLLGAAAVYFVPPQFWATAWRLPERVSTEALPPASREALPPPAVAVGPSPSASVEVAFATPVVAPASAAAPVASATEDAAPRAPVPVHASASASAPAPAPAPAPSAPTTPASAPGSGGRLSLMANASSWVEVLDSDGKVLFSRTLSPGEAVDLDGVFPLRLKVGNAAGLQVALRGRAVDLSSYTRDNVARFELR